MILTTQKARNHFLKTYLVICSKTPSQSALSGVCRLTLQRSAMVRAAHAEKFETAFVLPHSFRSALVPFLARVPERIGLPGHARDFMLTRVVSAPLRSGREHQSYEMLSLLAPDAPVPMELPKLAVPEDAREVASRAELGPQARGHGVASRTRC